MQCLLLALLCATTFSAVWAQTSGFLRGSVVDVHGSLLPGVAISVSGADLASAGRGTVTDAAGIFQISALPPGPNYQVRVTFPGLATTVLSDVQITAGEVTTLRITMPPEGALRERVRVHASAQVVNPETASTEIRISSEFLDALPVLGRNYQDVLTLAPGVTDVNGTGNPNIHGARDTEVVTLLDGVSTADPLTGRIGAQLNIESIQEIEVKTAGATAENGRAMGGFVNIVTKSGGNDFQGTFKFFWRGNRLDGDGAGIDDPRLHGGIGEQGLRGLKFNDFLPFLSVGGPILKDKAWYFAALEYIQTQEPVNALNQAFVTGIQEKRVFAKMTWEPSANHRLALSLNYDPQDLLNQGLNSFTREETGYTVRQGGPVLTLKETAILTPYAALETTASHLDQRPGQIPNLGADINGDGTLYYDRNGNGFHEAKERDPGEDYDKDGAFDVFEDTIKFNGMLDATETRDEDVDHDHHLTPVGGCEGVNREDLDCDGFLDRIDEDPNGNGRCDFGEPCDLDHDGRLDRGTEDRNHDGQLNDTPFPTSLYPYGRLKPLPPDRDYTIDQLKGIVSGPYYQDFSDRRGRQSLRQDLSVFIPDLKGSHDLKLGYAVERETFNRLASARNIMALKDPGFATGRLIDQIQHPEIDIKCNPYVTRCVDPGDGRVLALLPTQSSTDQRASGQTVGLYLQDTYKPRPNLTIGLGLRFDRETAHSSGLTFFDPATESAQFDRISALSGGNLGLDDPALGGVASAGILGDPIFLGLADLNGGTDNLVDRLRRAAISRVTRSPSELAFTFGQLSALFPDIGKSDALDPKVLASLGVRVQSPGSFAITNNNLAPRLSISWDPWSDGRTKVFATWGRYYDKLFLSSIVGEQGTERLERYYVLDRAGVDTTSSLFKGVISVTPNNHIGRTITEAPPSVAQIDRGLRTPFSDELTLGFEREIAPEVALSLRYINRRFRDELQDIDVNHTVRINPATGEPFDSFGAFQLVASNQVELPTLQRVPDGRPDLYIRNFFFNQVLRVGNFNQARYHAIEIQVVKRLARRWQLQTSYTYSRAVGAAEDFQSRLGDDPSTVESEFGYLDFDQRHVVKLNATTFLPGDWQVGIAASWSSGLPYSVISRFFASDNAGYLQLRTRYGFTTVAQGQSHFQGLRRNSERNSGVYDLNLRAKKNVVIGHTSAALFLEVFNLLNTDDLRIFTFEPSRAGTFVPGSQAVAASPLQLDATRRFGRRFQVGFQFDF